MPLEISPTQQDVAFDYSRCPEYHVHISCDAVLWKQPDGSYKSMDDMTKEKSEIDNSNQIIAYVHCGLCLVEYKDPENNDDARNASPAEYSRIQAGWTPHGLQIWCNRHNVNVTNIDFEGQQHPADTTAEIAHLEKVSDDNGS